MNRHQRRKLSRHATRDEIFPPDHAHAAIQAEIRDTMLAAIRALEDTFPGFFVTLFVSEREVPAGQTRLPRFNYVSNADRNDMLAVLDAFAARNRAEAAKLDRIEDAPPTERRQ